MQPPSQIAAVANDVAAGGLTRDAAETLRHSDVRALTARLLPTLERPSMLPPCTID
jgi:hypothetical protein